MDKRNIERAYIEPFDSGTFLEFRLGERQYRFNLLDTSPGGIGMLVKDGESKVLEALKIGDQVKMIYKTPEAYMPVDLEIKHISSIHSGKLKGHYQVGLSFIHGMS